MESPPAENESELGSPQSHVPAAILEGNEGQESNVPSSPPPSYEHVLEEVRTLISILSVLYCNNYI